MTTTDIPDAPTTVKTSEMFADAINGARVLRKLLGIEINDAELTTKLSNAYLIAGKRLDDGRDGFEFVDGSTAWKTKTGRWKCR